jgi:pimeloyl-ACP methyl ester carboxylesterase
MIFYRTFKMLAIAAVAALAACATSSAQERSHMQASIRNIVLVHGAWADGSGWEAVHRNLTARGYNVSIVQNPLTSFADDVAAVNRVLARQEGPVLLVGHSYGGALITEAGNADAVAGLVYVAAFAPDVGESVSTLIAGGGPPPVQVSGDGFLFFDPSIFPQAFAHDLPAVRANFLADAQIPTAAEAFDGAITEAAWRTKPSAYIVASEDRIIPPAAQRQMAARAHAAVTEIAASHAVYVSQPDAVADAIDRAARAPAH